MAPEKVYWIQTSDGRCLAMSSEDVGILVNMMTTLSFLFFGHPKMRAKVLKTTNDGIEILEIDPSLQVSQSSFILLWTCVRGVASLPARSDESRLIELEETMVKLGGCESLEKRLRDHSANPLTPEEDTEGKYIWRFRRKSRHSTCFEISSYEQLDDFSCASMQRDGDYIIQYLRKRR